jgi:hypothetical protein
MIRIFYLLLAVFTVNSIYSQNQFDFKYFSISPTRGEDFVFDGENIFVVGNTDYGLSGIFTVINNSGVITIKRKITTPNTSGFTKIIQLKDSSFATVGYANSTHGLCVRLNSQGDTLWTKTFGSSNGTVVIVNDIVEDQDSNLILVGNSGSRGFILKLSHSGSVVWSKEFNSSNLVAAFFELNALDVRSNGNVVIAGTEAITGQSEKGLLIELDSIGSVVQAIRCNETTSFRDLKIINGTIYGFDEVYGSLFQVDQNLNFQWANTYCNFIRSQMGNDAFIEQDNANNVLFTLNDGFYGHVLKIDTLGNPLNERSVIGMSIKSLEKQDGTPVVLSNGPVLGVKSSDFAHPHFGLMHGVSNQCSFVQSSFAFPFQYTSSSLPLNESGSIIPTQISIAISESDLQSEQGCIDILGDLTDLNAKEQILVSPNPSSGLLNIESTFSVPTAVSIVDAYGKECAHFQVDQNNSVLDLSYLDAGIYFIKTKLDTQRIILLK